MNRESCSQQVVLANITMMADSEGITLSSNPVDLLASKHLISTTMAALSENQQLP